MNKLHLSRMKSKKYFQNTDNILTVSTIVMMLLAIIISIPVANYSKLNGKQIYLISLPGIVFMNLMQMMILPLLILSLVSGLTSLNLSTSRKQGIFAALYFLLTTVLAVWLGIALAYIICPGKNIQPSNYIVENDRNIDTVSSVIDLFNNLFPNNIIRSSIQQSQTSFMNRTSITNNNGTRTLMLNLRASTTYSNGPNYLGLIFISIFSGVVLNYLGSRGQILVTIITVLNDLVMKMVKIILWYMPIGIFFLILSTLINDNIWSSFKQMYKFIITVILGLLIHMLVILPTIYVIIVKKNPYLLIKKMLRAMLVGFVTQSSSATMPVTINCVDENLKIDKRVTRFMIPIGAIVNMDGTGLFEAVSAIFISQIMNTPAVGFTTILMISMTSTLAAIGAASLPSGGLVTLLIVLSTAKLDAKYISLLYMCDWFLDRCRTAVNILGDAFGCGIIQSLCREELENDIDINDHFTTNF